jgi:alpha-1,3-rhamnosyl/mannosyltransferase
MIDEGGERRLRVAVNAVPLLSTHTGIGQYVKALMLNLAATGELALKYFYGAGWSNELRAEPLPIALNCYKPTLRALIPKAYEISRWLQQRRFESDLINWKAAVYHEPNFLAFRFDGPTVLTVHDLSWIRFPDTHPPERVRAMNRLFEPSLRRADRIITDSTFVKQELVDVFGVDASTVHDIHLAADTSFHPRTSVETSIFLRTRDLEHGAYWLVLGTLEPRKNLHVAIEAFSALPQAVREKCPLVLVGMVGWKMGPLLPKIHAMVRAGELRQLGYLNQEHLKLVVAGAKALLFPSVYEGFGLPLVEAMQCGIPVLASEASSFPEVLGTAGLLFQSGDADALRDLMIQVFDDAHLRERLSFRGLERTRSFSWQKTAQQTLDVYRLAAR